MPDPVPLAEAHAALDRLRAGVASCEPGLLGDLDVLERAVRDRDALKKAGDAVAHLVSHPSRNIGPMLQAVVDYRTVSERFGE